MGRQSWELPELESSLRTGWSADGPCPTAAPDVRSFQFRFVDLRVGSTYATFQWTAVDVVATELANGHGCIFVSVHLDESKSTVCLETRLNNVTEVLKQRDEILLGRVGGEVANVTGGLPLRSLSNDHIVALNAMLWEAVVAIRSGGRHSHLRHGSLLRDGWLALLVGPVAADGTRSKPLSVHRRKSSLGISTVAECNEAVTTRATSLHVPHHASLGNGAKRRESLKENLIVDFVGEVTDEDVKVTASVLLVVVVGLVSPIDTNFLKVLIRPSLSTQNCLCLRIGEHGDR